MKNFLDYASKKYYDGEPIISDAEFDKLAEEHSYEKVGADTQSGVPHMFPMYSLNKCYDDSIVLDGETVETPKLDGAAISLLYVGGKYMRALTRGDGKRGQDITENVRYLVPNQIDYLQPLQITGEVVAPKEISNARNYAAGALNLKDTEEFQKRTLKFIAHGVDPMYLHNYTDAMQMLGEELGFSTILDSDWQEYPQDGTVVRLNSYEAFNRAGYTSKHPRGAVARKVQQAGPITTLERVDWQTNRTGIVSPVAILTPVKVGDATVSRATLHNMRYIEELGLELGCQVEIIRSGEIIPRVVRRVD